MAIMVIMAYTVLLKELCLLGTKRNVKKISSDYQIYWISRIRWMHTRDGADKERESGYARPQKREQSISGHSLMPNPI